MPECVHGPHESWSDDLLDGLVYNATHYPDFPGWARTVVDLVAELRLARAKRACPHCGNWVCGGDGMRCLAEMVDGPGSMAWIATHSPEQDCFRWPRDERDA